MTKQDDLAAWGYFYVLNSDFSPKLATNALTDNVYVKLTVLEVLFSDPKVNMYQVAKRALCYNCN